MIVGNVKLDRIHRNLLKVELTISFLLDSTYTLAVQYKCLVGNDSFFNGGIDNYSSNKHGRYKSN